MVNPILTKEPFPTMDLRIDRGQGPHRLGTIQVGDGSKQVRQILEEVGHSPTLIVDEEESHIVGVEVDGKAQDIRLNGFRLTRTGCPCDQTVWPMSFFMEIEVDQIVLPAQTDRHGQTLVRSMALPTTQDLKVIESLCLVHFKEGHRVWNGTLKLLDMLERSKATRDGFLVITFREVVQLEVELPKNPFLQEQLPLVAVLDRDNGLDIFRKR